MVREMHTGQRAGAQIIRAMCVLVVLLVPIRVAGYVLGRLLLLLLLRVALEHLLEELELGGGEGEKGREEEDEGEEKGCGEDVAHG